MTATVPPPPAQALPPHQPADQRPPQPPRGSAPRVIALLTVGLGALIVVGTVVNGAVPTLASAIAHAETHRVAVSGVNELDVDVSAASLTVVFDDVDEASLRVTDSGGGPWAFGVDGGSLRVETPRAPFLGWFRGGNGSAVLTLPDRLEGSLDASFTHGAGELVVGGDYADLGFELGAGEMTVTGSARTLRVDVNAGRADIDLHDVADAEFNVGAGGMDASLTGDAPDDVQVRVNAGTFDLTLPDAAYDVSSDVSAGDFDNGLRVQPGAPHRVSVEVAAGNARILAD